MASSNKTALVTGSTNGIGLACIHALAKRGVNIVITGSRDKSLVSSIITDIEGYGVRADYVRADLTKLADIDALWSEVIRLYPDGVDILVNNAGVLHLGPIEFIPDDQWDNTIAVMLTAPFQLTKRCLPAMKKKGWGRIINISSALGLVGLVPFTAFSTAKHGLIGLTKGVALETAALGITCNAVCPVMTDTPTIRAGNESMAAAKGISVEEAQNSLQSLLPTGKMLTPDQVAELVEFLCLSNASSQITGASYLIDCGTTAS